ncbi:unnamed protein product [Phytophthora lilii]|uniref:Unnamed protein product n=1 Tax=Phytophthora lilii TaxID=2077276 RepID=A0A9W7CVZ6_9STRA|nr:unnamed protein product [Phytophthora lilii]
MVTSLFTTGSGKSVSVSKERLEAYEGKVAEDEVWIESGSSSKCGGSSGLRGEENCTLNDLDPSKSSYNLSAAKSSNFIEHTRDVRKRHSIVLNTRAFSDREHDQLVPPAGAREQIKSRSNVHAHQDQGLNCGDKENVHPENVLVRKTAALEASKWRSSQLNSRFPHKCRDNQITQQQRSAKRTLKPLLESRSQVSGKKRFRPPLPSKKNPSSITKVNMETSSPSGPRPKKRKIASPEAQPFVYKEAMKISFVVLVGLREANLGLVDEGNEVPRSKVLNSITAENAVNVRFTSDDGLVCSEGPSGATVFTGPHELYSQLKTGGYILEKAGATFAWFTNHYRWIVWKLAAMERSFPRLLLNRYLTKQQVLKQMTYRYQRELNDAQRSILKKILQRDASSLSCMVLCIAAVLPFPRDANKAAHQELPACWNMALVLTDGWYSVYAVPDAPLAGVLWKLHSQSRLIGTKLATWNAVLQNSNDGIDPLECAISRELLWKNPLIAKEDLTQWPYLQLRYNSTRRVSFDTQLGVEELHYVTPMNSRHRKQQPQLTFSLLKSVPLKSLEVGGGMVRSVRVRVTRISPVLHLQAKEWTLGPRILCEEQLPTYFQLRSEYGRMSIESKHHRDGGDRIIDDWVSDDQIDLPPPIPFIKVDVECSHPLGHDRQGVGCGILTIWRPSEELLSGGLREGVEYFASSLTINWKIDGGHNQDAFLRLSSTKHSGFEEIHESSSLAGNELKVTAMSDLSHRECVDIQQATRDYRTKFENGLNGRRNEKRPTIDVCVCVVLVAARETQDGAMKRRAEVSLLDPALKPNETRYVEHVFVTDLSGHLMSIRVSSMEVSMPTKKRNSPLKQGSSSSFVFRRGSKAIWKEGTIMCLSGLEISHYDEQLRVLDCVLVESTQIISYPSKKSPFWEHFHLLQRDLSAFSPRGVEPTNFAKELTQLKKYVERDILRMDYIPSQECDEHQVEVVEQERLTQDLQAHEEGGGGVLSLQAGNDSSSSLLRNLRWDATIVKISPLVGASKVVFSHDMIAFASVSIGKGDTAFRTVYLTRGAMASINSLLQLSNSSVGGKMDKATELTATLVQSVSSSLSTIKQRGGAKAFRLEVRHVTNERLINSWKPWERLHFSYWMVTTVEDLPPKK